MVGTHTHKPPCGLSLWESLNYLHRQPHSQEVGGREFAPSVAMLDILPSAPDRLSCHHRWLLDPSCAGPCVLRVARSVAASLNSLDDSLAMLGAK